MCVDSKLQCTAETRRNMLTANGKTTLETPPDPSQPFLPQHSSALVSKYQVISGGTGGKD